MSERPDALAMAAWMRTQATDSQIAAVLLHRDAIAAERKSLLSELKALSEAVSRYQFDSTVKVDSGDIPSWLASLQQVVACLQSSRALIAKLEGQ